MDMFWFSISLFDKKRNRKKYMNWLQFVGISLCSLCFNGQFRNNNFFAGMKPTFCYKFGIKILFWRFLMAVLSLYFFWLSAFYCFANNILCDCTFLENRNKDTLALCMLERCGWPNVFSAADLKRQRGFGRKKHGDLFSLTDRLTACSAYAVQRTKKSRDKENLFSVWLCTINWRWEWHKKRSNIRKRDLVFGRGICGRLFNRPEPLAQNLF